MTDKKEDKKMNDDVFDEFEDENPDSEALSRETPSDKEVELQEKIDSLQDQLIRAHAEMENTRKRARIDVEDAHRFGLKKFANDLLPVIDTLERSLDVPVEGNELAAKVHEGVQMTLDIFASTLAKFEVEAIEPEGEAFNAEYHQAVQTEEDPEAKSGNVLKVLQKGYLLNGRLLRPAMVVIAK